MNKVDKDYLDLLYNILYNGVEKETRSGRVKSVFSRTIRIDLKDGFPLLTTKKMFYRGIIEELLWFLSGSTNIKPLLEKNVHIWDSDAYRHYCNIVVANNKLNNNHFILTKLSKDEFIEKTFNNEVIKYVKSENNFDVKVNEYKFGDLGPIYGYQWRNFGGSGVDQIKNIIDTLKKNPNDRRLLCVAYNPSDLDKMALPPCHVMFQFYVRKLTINDKKKYYCTIHNTKTVNENELKLLPNYGLSCKWSQRSVDTFLGLPFNIASYAALTYMIAEIVGMIPDELIGDLGDTHIYLNHMDAINEQLKRIGYDTLPTLTFNRKIDSIDDFKYEDFNITNYKSDGKISAPLSVG